tara:strand:- start:848 stop:1513 length:666 start_codon:yes stop_codon:yes gene_type:complete
MNEVINTDQFVTEAVSIIKSTIAESNESVFRMSLCGGGTPRPVYEALVNEAIDWENLEITFSDERCVPPSHDDSNYKMAAEALLSKVSIKENNIIRIKGELDPVESASQCEDQLRKRSNGSIYMHDLLLLGMGEDGHTASLFPGTSALNESERWVVDNYIPDKDVNRVTFSYPLINASRKILVLATGEKKKKLVNDMIDGDESFPISKISPDNGKVIWLLG